ncbi:MAG: hypothetical protein U0163_20370 [Gemmatimonadaceae bacterium]
MASRRAPAGLPRPRLHVCAALREKNLGSRAAQSALNPGTFEFARDYRDLFRAHPINTILLKIAYWLNP